VTSAVRTARVCLSLGSSHPLPDPFPTPDLIIRTRISNRQTAGIPAADLIYINYDNMVEGLLPYMVALDTQVRGLTDV
jgi:hypothetical protein